MVEVEVIAPALLVSARPAVEVIGPERMALPEDVMVTPVPLTVPLFVNVPPVEVRLTAPPVAVTLATARLPAV